MSQRGIPAGAAAALAAALLTACGPAAGPGASSSSSERQGSPTRAEERLGEALTAEGSEVADVLDDDSTRVRDVESPFPRWHVLEVQQLGGDHPLQWVFVVNRSGEPDAVNLAADPEAWSDVLDGVQITDEDEAEELAASYVDLTHDAAEGVYRVSGPDDVRWLPRDSEGAPRAVSSDRERVRARAHPPRATASGGGWQVTLTAMHRDRLVRHVLTVSRGGAVEESTRTLAEGLSTRIER